MDFIAGIDGGGTKTTILIGETNGNVIDKVKLGAFNINSIKEEGFRALIDEVISVKFSHRNDIKLSLYFDEQENEDTEDVEEAALFYMHNGELSMSSGTLTDILVELDTYL